MNLNQITVPSLNVEKAIEFYQKLGLKLIVKVIPNYARFECVEGDSTLSIHLVEGLPKGQGVTLYFENEKLDEVVKELQNKGLIFNSMPEDKFWLWREADLNDPDGNQIILYKAGSNRKNPPWRID
jgi:catechol 2,3-dioxygenase-like lactoylglutathione lyase family enzyme